MKSISPLFAIVFAMALLFSSSAIGQVSFGLTIGAVACTDSDDPYGLNTQWPAPASTSGSSGSSGSGSSGIGGSTKMVIAEQGTGLSKALFLTWEASEIFGITLVYRNVDLSMPQSARKASSNGLGLQFKVNFISNTKRIVPFVQGEFMFANSNTISQSAATSTKYPAQTQPTFDASFSTNLGVGGDLGLEVKLTDAFRLLLMGGVHGVEWAGAEGSSFASTLNYGAAYATPNSFDGVFYTQFAGGVKYYLGKSKKKRDF